MSKRDVLDPAMARRFAWRTAAPEDWEEPDEDKAPPPRPPEEQLSSAERERWDRVRRDCAELALQVERVWEMTPASRQAAATATLLDRADRLGIDLIAFDAHPLAFVRLWRLVVRHLKRLPAKGRRRKLHGLGFATQTLDHREVIDLLVEVAESGDPELAFLMEQGPADEATGRRYPELGQRLARVLAESKSWDAREIAARWLSIAELRDAIPALRSALRMPHARIRWAALEILIERAPEALLAEDVQWLLEDAVKHPLATAVSSRAHDTVDGYASALCEAVAKVKPPEGWRPLTIIAEGGGELIHGEREGLDDGWAIRALAAGYPERALPRIDRELATSSFSRRYDAVEALRYVPEELARPRLLAATGSVTSYVAEKARKIWFERFGSECPIDPLSGVQAELLAEPPSERMLSRLTVLRGSSNEAKVSMVSALLAEAPPEPAEGEEPPDLGAAQRETLALLVYALHEGTYPYSTAGLPNSYEKWATLLMKRFGAPAFEAIAARAANEARAGVDLGWLSALASCAREGALRPAWRDRLRAIAVEALGSPAWDGSGAPLSVLRQVGAPTELVERLWSITVSRPQGGERRAWHRAHAAHSAAEVLIAMPEAPGLEALLMAEAAAAREARDWERLKEVLRIGCRRKIPAAIALAEDLLATIDEEPGHGIAARWSLDELREAGRLDEAWVLAALDHPESRRFEIAVSLTGRKPSLAALAALQRALDSTARNGAAAAEAARHLVGCHAIGIDDRRLDGILARAPLMERAELLGMLLLLEAPLAPLRRHYADVLTGPDEKAAAEAFEDLHGRKPDGTFELLQSVRPLVSARNVRESIDDDLGEPNEAELYWRHSDDDEDEDEDELE